MGAEQSKEQESQTFIWDQKIETEETQNSETVELSYNIYNEGPSMSKESKLYTFIPTYSDLVANPQVEFIGQKCVKGDLSKNQKVPDPPRTSAANGEVIVCHNRGDCDVYECNLPKAMEKREKLNLRIKYDFMKKHAKKMEKVTRFQGRKGHHRKEITLNTLLMMVTTCGILEIITSQAENNDAHGLALSPAVLHSYTFSY